MTSFKNTNVYNLCGPFGEWVSTTSNFCFKASEQFFSFIMENGENVLLFLWDDVCFCTKPTCRVWFFKKSGVVFLFFSYIEGLYFVKTMNDPILFKSCFIVFKSITTYWLYILDIYFHGLQVLGLGTAEDNLYQQSPFPCLSFYTIHAYVSEIMRKYIQNSQIFQYLLFKINIYSKVSCCWVWEFFL